MSAALAAAIRAACMADVLATADSSCKWPECRCVIQPAVRAAIIAFIATPHLLISEECRQALRDALGRLDESCGA